VKPSITKLVLAPFTTDAAEYNVLEQGKAINIATSHRRTFRSTRARPSTRRTAARRKERPAARGQLQLRPAYPWGVNYFALNYTNPATGPIFKQLYIRQAMQTLMNQSLWIQLYSAGYGAPTYGPVPCSAD